MQLGDGKHKRPESLPPLVFDTLNGSGGDYNQLGNPASILRKLVEIQRKRMPVKLHVFDDGELAGMFDSTFHRVEHDHNHIVLHQLAPNSWRDVVLDTHPVTVNCYLPSGHLIFDTVISPLERHANNPFCKIALPSVLHVQQLRAAYRVPLLPNTGRVELRLGRHLIEGKCLDISLNGCCAQFPGTLLDLLDANPIGAGGYPLRLFHNREELCQASVKICRQKLESFGVVTAGLQFTRPDPQRTRRLQQLVLQLQRTNIRQQPVLDD